MKRKVFAASMLSLSMTASMLMSPLSPLAVAVHAQSSETATNSSTNIARGKTAVASSIEANSVAASNATDGDSTSRSSRWGSNIGSGPHWIYVDLGSTQDIQTVKLFWENRKANSYKIQVAQDGATAEQLSGTDASVWSEFYNSSKPEKLNETIVSEAPVQGRYVRLYIDSNTSEDPDGGVTWNTVSIYEMEVYGSVLAKTYTAQEVVDMVEVEAPTAGTAKLMYTLPEVEGYTVKYNGTDLEQIIDANGNIHQPLVDKKVSVSFKAENEETGEFAFKEVTYTIPGKYTVEAQDNAAPAILPELQEWKGKEGVFTVAKTARILYSDDTFAYAAKALADDYKEMTGVELSVVKTAQAAGAGDIVFVKDASESSALGKEGYTLNIGDTIEIGAAEETGAYWSTRTLLQAFVQSSDKASINKGETRDYPTYEVRGLILDVGRKPFTLEWIQQAVKMMSWYKMNDFQLHLNDNYIFLEKYTEAGKDPMTAYSGFRLESDITEGGNGGLNKADLTSTDTFYTKEEFRNLIQEARAVGVNIVPEIDTPAHSLALTKVRPDLRQGTSGRENDHLNLKGKYEESLEFVKSIFSEYLTEENPVFDKDTIVHIGADEYEADKDAYRKFVNDMIEYVEETGRTARVWGSFTQLNGSEKINAKGVQINLWNSYWANIYEMYADGFDLINCRDSRFYIVPNAGYYWDYLSQKNVYNNKINNIDNQIVPAGDPQMIGGAIAIWNDMIDDRETGVHSYDIYDRLSYSLGLYAANLWGKGSLKVTEASDRMYELNYVIPGVNFEHDIKHEGDAVTVIDMDSTTDMSGNGYDLKLNDTAAIETVDGKNALKLTGGSSYAELDGLTTGGIYTDLRVKVKRTSDSTAEQILFESSEGALKAVQKDTGKVGFSRENIDYSFNYELPVDEWVDLEIRNEFEVTTLYINGKAVDSLGSRESQAFKATFLMPLQYVGSMTNAFEGYVDDIRYGAVKDEGETPFRNTMPLEEKIIEAAAVENMTDELKAALENARTVAKQYDPSNADINAAIKALEESVAEATKDPLDKTYLQTAYDAAMEADTEGVNQAIKDEFTSTLEKAKTLLDAKKGDQDEIDETTKLLNALTRLVQRSAELDKAIKEAEMTDLDLYADDADKEAFIKVLEAAKALHMLESKAEENDLKAAAEDLMDAKENLNMKEADKEETPGDETPEEPKEETPGEDLNPEEPGTETPGDETPEQPKDETPGDETPEQPKDEMPGEEEKPEESGTEMPGDETPEQPKDETPGEEMKPVEPGEETPGDETPEQPKDETPGEEEKPETPGDETSEDPKDEKPAEESKDDTAAKLDIQKLIELIKKVKAADLNTYLSKGQDELKAALTNAEEVLKNAKTQDEINTAVETLDKAFAALTAKTETGTSDNNTQTTNTAQNTASGKTSTVKTGVNSAAPGFIAAAAAALGAMLSLRKRRK